MQRLAAPTGPQAVPRAACLARARQTALAGGQPLLPPYCWLHRRTSMAPRRSTLPITAAGAGADGGRDGDGWQSDDGSPMAELRSKLQPLGEAFRRAVQALWEAQRRWLQHSLARMALGLALLAAAATGAANLWGVPALNRRLLPQVQAAASSLLQREVALGAVRWVAPTGLVGLTPLASVGPISVGPGPVERSSARLPAATVGIDPLQSLLQQRVVLVVKAQGGQVDLRQADNYSWFGYPEDTVPSARDFVPGARGGGSGGNGDGGGGGSTATPGSGAGGSGGSPGANSSAGDAGSEVQRRMEALASRTASSGQQLQALVERLTQELAAASAQPAPGNAVASSEQQPAVVLMGLGGAGAGQPQPQPPSQPSSSTAGEPRFSQHQAPGSGASLLRQGVARMAPDSSSSSSSSDSSFLGGKLGWWRGPSGPPQPQSQPQPTATPAQRHVAALNAMHLQAGRGYSLVPPQPGAPAPAPAPAAADDAAVQPASSNEVGVSADGAAQAADHAASSSGSAQAESAAEVELAGQRSSATLAAEQQQQQQQQQQKLHEPQHRKRRRKDTALTQQQQQQQQQAASALPAAVAAAEEDAEPHANSSSSSGSSSQASGSAAALNQGLPTLQARSSKLYSATATQELPPPVVVGPSDAEAAQSAAAPAEPAVDIEEAAAAPGTEPPAAMTAEQRRRAVGAINSLPAIVVGQRRTPAAEAAAAASAAAAEQAAAAAAAEAEQMQAAVQEESPAVRRINAIGAVVAPEELQPEARVPAAARQGAFAAAVVDPATQNRKLGSAALPWSHQRPPASVLIGKRLDGASAGRVQAEAAPSVEHAAAVQDGAGAEAMAAGGEGGYQVEGSPAGSDGDAAPTKPAAAASRRQALLHPGYFTRRRGPNYTPAPPEALIDARARRTTLGSFMRAALAAALEQVGAPEVALGRIQLKGVTLDAYVHGEALPRRFADLSAGVRLGPAYDSLAVDLSASPYERHASAAKCTMPSPHAHRHLRHVTGAAAVRAYRANLEAAAAGDDAAAEAASAAAEGRPDSAAFQAAAAAPAVPTPDEAYAGRPTGGRVRVLVDATHITRGEVPPLGTQPAPGALVPQLDIRVQGAGLSAPLIERLIELPMDISAGRADGELRIYSHDADSWHFPEFYGRVAVRGADFHFWDATDDISGADLDLCFEKGRLYMHNARGAFGAVPLTLTGALDLDPVRGQYQLSARVAGVEVNALRATLGLRPTPQPVAGAVGGVLHVTGPLEKPVFSGTAVALRPTPAQLADCEATDALAALLAEPRAVGAYDRVPFAAASAVFQLDTARETFQLHSLHADLVDGGELHGTGRMWVAPRAEADPSAVSIRAEGRELGVEAVARRYMPDGVAPPPGMVVGRASLSATMQGSHLEPTLDVALQLPDASASCTVQLRRAAARVALASPSADAAGTLHLWPPSFEAVKAAITQAEASALAQPNVTGLDADISLRGLDALPLISDQQAMRQLAVQSGQPLRLKLNGRARVSGTVAKAAQPAAAVAPGAEAEAGASSSSSGSAGSSAAPAGPGSGWVFSGDLGLEAVRVNQLKLWQKLAGRLSVSGAGVSVHGRGLRANETLDLDLALPLFQQPAAAAAAAEEQQVAVPETVAEPQQEAEQQAAAAEEQAEAEAATSADAAEALPEQPGSTPVGLPPLAAPEPAAAAVAAVAAAQPPAPQQQVQPAQQQQQAAAGGGGLQLRCGPLQVAANINSAGSQLDFKVAALKLDELELASLRGDLQEVSCSLNFEAHSGRGKLALANPRYSGLRGDSLSGGFRWERDIVRLEKLVLQQQRSRYEAQGEYTLPANLPLPRSAADLALQPAAGAGEVPGGGRWRVQVSVPAAELQEIIPAARLLQSATSLSASEYERVKGAFLQAIDKASIRAADLNTQLRAMAQAAAPAQAAAKAGAGTRGGSPGPKDVGRAGAGLQLPGLQEVRGQWGGSIQAYGGGGGATSCDFDVRGQGWQWGAYGLDALVASGSYHSEEGVALQEFVLKAGDAKLSVRGSLLGEHQDASLLLTDFPMATLRPLFRAVPALQNAAPAVPAERPQPVASPRPLGMLTHALGRATKGLGGGGMGLGAADSPINGLLYVSGNIAGSSAQPTGEVAVRLYDAAVGPTRLSQARAEARLSEAQQLSFSVEVVPAEGHRQAGYVRAAGVVPLADAAASGGSSGGQHAGAPHALQTAQAAAAQQMDVRLSVKDGGMAVLTSVTPDVQWLGGQAAIDVRLRGPLDRPVLSGAASLSKASLECPVLRFPLTAVSAEVRAGGDLLTVDALEARCGRRGHIRARGSLPVYGAGSRSSSAGSQQPPPLRLSAEASGLELRVRNLYSGQYDASLGVTGSLAQPSVGGSMRFSRGIVFIVPQGAPDVAGTASAGGSNTLLTPSGGGGGASGQQQQQGSSVCKVFDILTRGESGLAQQFEAVMKQEVEAVEHMVEDAGQHNVSLDGLAIRLGPDLRAMYPLVMNFGVEGELTVSGPAHPDQVRVRGTVRLPSGDVNLVATQLALDREHANLINFQAEQGLDPVVDLVMSGGDLRVAIQARGRGRASEWQDHLTLHYVSSDKARPDSGGEQLDAADAARIFEDKLKAALLAEDGQLALSRLAGTTVSTLMPKIETQGQVGGTRWRLVSAPSIPGLLSLDPSLADPSNILSNITMGTEVEVQFGKKLQAAMVRKLQESSDVTTQWSLNYKLNSKLRMQFNITSAPPFPKTLMFQYSSEGSSS